MKFHQFDRIIIVVVVVIIIIILLLLLLLLLLLSLSLLDIKVGGFWSRGVTAFFDLRVTHVNSKCYQNKTTSEVFKKQEDE